MNFKLAIRNPRAGATLWWAKYASKEFSAEPGWVDLNTGLDFGNVGDEGVLSIALLLDKSMPSVYHEAFAPVNESVYVYDDYFGVQAGDISIGSLEDAEKWQTPKTRKAPIKWLLIGGAILLLILVALYIWRKG